VTADVPALLDYIPIVSPNKRAPYHLAEYVALFDRIRRGEPVRALVTYPIRHWKTETTLHGLLWLLEHDPTIAILLVAHSHERVKWLGKRLRELVEMRDEMKESGKIAFGRDRIGPRRNWNEIHYWSNEYGGSVLIMSPEQSREGFDVHVLIADDPLDEDGAKKPDVRDLVDEKLARYTTRCMRNGKPGPVVVVMSRWNLYDPVELRLERRDVEPWEVFHRPAVIEADGERRAFAPEVWSLDALDRERAVIRRRDPNEREWWSRFQGDPRPEDRVGFGPAKRYVDCPAWPGFVDFMGVDMSYSKEKRADFAAIVVVRWLGGTCYVRAVKRARGETGDLAKLIRDTQAVYGKLPMFSYTSGPEKAALLYFASIGLPIQGVHTQEPKFIRATPAIDAHNAGQILWPYEPWVDDVMGRFKRFSGNEAEHDDEVDALVSVFNLTRTVGASMGTSVVGQRRM
jgi:predicted phage terminase large subunit-like protein